MSDAPKIPPRTDLIEVLYVDGHAPIAHVYQYCGSVETAWRIIPRLVEERIARLCVLEGHTERDLERWEIDRLVRCRIDGSSDETPPDHAFILRAGARVGEAYTREFGAWFDRAFGHQS